MKYHELTVTTKTAKKRVGRGIAAGAGKTAGRGTKGQKARTGKKLIPGFEGGQTKLSARLPKARGFTPHRRSVYAVINLDDLARVSAATVDGAALVKAGLIKKTDTKVKLLSDGAVSKAYTVRLAAVSKAARAKIEQAGGSVVIAASKPKTAVARSDKSSDNKKVT